MGLKEVTKAIIEEAEKQAEQLEKEAEESVDQIEMDAKREIDGYRKMKEKEMAEVTEKTRKKEESSSVFDGKRLMLDKKKEIISLVKDEVKARFMKLSDKDREKYVHALFKTAAAEISVRKLFLSRKDKKYVVALIGAKNIEVVDSDILGGLIAENEGGTISVDYSFETHLDNMMHKSLKELSEVLFNG